MLGYFPGLQPDESGRKIVGPTAKGLIVLMRLCRPLHRRLKKCDSKFDGPANDIRYTLLRTAPWSEAIVSSGFEPAC